MSFEFYVAGRYLRAKRKQKFISLVTAIAVGGVAVGVAALVVAMAINNGVQRDLEQHLLGANSHINLLEKERGFGIEDWRSFIREFRNVEHVVALAPVLYGEVMISGPLRGRGCILKGIDPAAELEVADLLTHITEGDIDNLSRSEGHPGIIIGKRLAMAIGARLHSVVTLMNPQGEMTPFGLVPGYKRFRVAAVFESGFFEYDAHWALTTLDSAQQSLSLGDVINAVEFKLDDSQLAPEVAAEIERLAGAKFAAETWMDRNRDIFNALELEKLVTTVTISLIMLVAALNILTSLVMMVMEKHRDIALLISMGAKRRQIRKIFVLQGLVIGGIGVAAGLVVGHAVSWLCQAYRLVPLDAEVYGLSYVPFSPRFVDGVGIAVAAMLISYVTTIYPSSTATKILPAEILRYE